MSAPSNCSISASALESAWDGVVFSPHRTALPSGLVVDPKASAEPLSIDEAHITSLLKPSGDATQLSDFAAVKPVKGFIVGASFVDQIVRSIGFIRLFDDMTEITDTLARSPTKRGADSSFISERARRQTEKMSGEQALVIDASRRDVLRTMAMKWSSGTVGPLPLTDAGIGYALNGVFTWLYRIQIGRAHV